MESKEIRLRVATSDDGVEAITWRADDGAAAEQSVKAFLLALWEPGSKQALRLDLWTKDMPVDDMNDFFFQTLMTMADTYGRATTFTPLAGEIKVFAQEFAQKAAAATRRSMGSG